MHPRHAPQPLSITEREIDQPEVGHRWFPLGVIFSLPKSERSIATIDWFFASVNLHRTMCGRQLANGRNYRASCTFNRQVNNGRRASISPTGRKLGRPASNHDRVTATSPATTGSAQDPRAPMVPGRAESATDRLTDDVCSSLAWRRGHSRRLFSLRVRETGLPERNTAGPSREPSAVRPRRGERCGAASRLCLPPRLARRPTDSRRASFCPSPPPTSSSRNRRRGPMA